MKKFFSINELCRLTKVSVRTLHHYDEMGILKPHHRTSKNHRRYSEEDLLRLQQIAIFKFMGFSLLEIKKILQQEKFNIFESLQIQAQALFEQIGYIQKIAKLINYLILQHELQQTVDWETVIQIMEVLKSNKIDSREWHQRYLNTIEQQLYDHVGIKRMDEWCVLMNEVKKKLNSSETLHDDIELVKKWISMANESYGDQPELINKLWEAFKAGIIPSQLPNDKKIIAYITKAFEKLQN